ncbi:MAG: LptA/OstA family protein [Kiritimatiellae bacterium]|nr:LptA/OstA family protein [Kiritimatiellia bacterium]
MKRVLAVTLCLSLAGMATIGTAAAKDARKGETVITSNRLEYDYKESVVMFEENVKVADPQFTMTADRVLVFLAGTNDVRQVRAVGNVVFVSEGRSARCAQAVYTRADGKIVMTGNDVVLQRAKDQVWGKEVTIWVNDQRMECKPARMVIQQETIQGDGGRVLP